MGRLRTAPGANGFYHIVGFGAVVFTGDGTSTPSGCEGAAIDSTCDNVEGNYVWTATFCAAPDGSFTIDVTGEVRLVR